MNKKSVCYTFALALLLSAILDVGCSPASVYASSIGNLTSEESKIISLVNGTTAYDFDLELEKIAMSRVLSSYAFRSGGSTGANATVQWLKDQMESLGLETHLESFMFTNWNLPSRSTLILDEDGLIDTTDDQTVINSFQCEHYSWPTSEGGVFADLVVLPLPTASSYPEIGVRPINATLWNTIDTEGKIVLIGREVRLNRTWEQTYRDKLSAQPPAAVIYSWSYPWMSFAPPSFSSVGGRPTSSFGPYCWDSEIASGEVNYDEGKSIRDKENSANVSAKVNVPSTVGIGPHCNVVGRLQGVVDPSKLVIICGHYDTVMCAGFGDNGAGTSGVLEVARVLTKANRDGLYNPGYTILFVAFASEELGCVGSVNFVRQHKTEMKDIVAVINLDCLGSEALGVTKTEPSEAFDLDELILKAAKDLNINAVLKEPIGSDHQIFLNPSEGENTYSYWWPGLTASISDSAPVKSSTMLISYPLYYSDKWTMGKAGWIHTPYDNSSSTQNLSWLKPEILEEHIKVAALSLLRIYPSSQGDKPLPIPWWAICATIVGVAATLTALYFVKARKLPNGHHLERKLIQHKSTEDTRRFQVLVKREKWSHR